MIELLNEYLFYIKQKNLSSNTIEAYRRDLIKFANFLKEKGTSFELVQEITLMKYVQELSTLGKSNASIARNIVSIRNFYKYLSKCGKLDNIEIIHYEIPVVGRTLPNVLTVKEVDLLLSAPNIEIDKGKRDKAMLELMYGTGIKISEILNLKVSDINLKLKYIVCSGSKGRERIIPLGKYATKFLLEYLEIRNKFILETDNHLFSNTNGKKMSRQGFWKVLKTYASESGIKKEITLNTLRHSFAVHMIENGADLKSIQEFLGYKDIGAVQVYLNVAKRNKLGEVYNMAHPRA